MLLAFYSIALFLVTMEEKDREIYKEVMGLSLLYGASALNLFLTGPLRAYAPLSVSMLLFLFIINRVRIMPFVAGYTVACVVVLVADRLAGARQGRPASSTRERYALFACAFWRSSSSTFVAFVKRTDMVAVLAFFGLLYVSVDLLMSVGFSLKGVLLHEPVLGLFVVGPLMGMVMKGGKERR